MNQKLLSPQELAIRLSRIRDYGACRGDGAPIEEAVAAIRAHIAALATERDMLRTEAASASRRAEAVEGQFKKAITEDARWADVGRAAALALSPFSKSDAELLDVVLQRALVRARNEGLDLAAASEEYAAMAWEEMGDADEAKRCRARASNIRAMKETEE